MIEKVFENFKQEAELFFVKKMIVGEKLRKEYSDCLDIIYNVTGTQDVTKGIFAFNTQYGQGKSFFFDVVNHRNRRTKGKFAFKRTTARELCDLYVSAKKGQDPKEVLNEFIRVKNLFIDDIGDELKDGKERSNYANKLNVLRYVLLKRYDYWNEKGWRTFATTNLTIQQIAQNYDGRVADRIMQMAYFKEFKFLAKGSFRQMKESRKLTQQEIALSWEKFRKPEVIEKVDLEKYFNELIEEDDRYFENKDLSYWTFVRKYLEDKSLLSEKDYDSISEDDLDATELLIRKDTRETVRRGLKHAGGQIVKNAIDKAVNQIRKKDVFESAKNIIARKKFFELRNLKHIFK